MTGAERQRKWLEKNRALHNFRRREARKKNLPVDKCPPSGGSTDQRVMKAGSLPANPLNDPENPRYGSADEAGVVGESRGSSGGAETVRAIPSGLVAVSSDKFPRLLKLAKPVVPEIVVAKPQVYRNDYGAVISEAAWKRLQKMKAEAKEKNYELDEYSQL